MVYFSECTKCQGTTYQAAPCSSTQDTICIGQFSHTPPLNINLQKTKGHLSIDKRHSILFLYKSHTCMHGSRIFFGGGSEAYFHTPSPPSTCRFVHAPTSETFTSRRSRGTCQERRHITLLCKLLDDIYPVSIHI